MKADPGFVVLPTSFAGVARASMQPAEPTLHDLRARRKRAISRALGYLERIAGQAAVLSRLGSGFLYCTAFMATTAADPLLVRRARRLAMRALSARNDVWNQPLEPTTSDELAELVHGHLAGHRLGIRFPRRVAGLRDHAARFDATSLLGWTPGKEPPPVGLRSRCECGWCSPARAATCRNPDCREPLVLQSRRRTWCLALVAAYCGERLGVRLGGRFAEVLAWLPELPDYPTPQRGLGGFYDAAYAVTHVVYTLNDFGRHQLDPAWLPREYEFLRRHLEYVIDLDDPDLLGEFLDTLRAFGSADDHPAIRAGMLRLLAGQNRDGSWGSTDDGDPYRRFHATWAAIDGLRDFAWRGQGLSFPALLPMLRRWARRA